MFRAQTNTASKGVRATIVLILAMLATSGIMVWLVAEIQKEQRAVHAIMRGSSAADIEQLGTLPGELRVQMILTIIALIVVVVSAVELLLVVRAYLRSQESLRSVKMLAWDILASTNQGVITTDCDGRVTSVNPRSKELLGITDEWVGRPITEVCGPHRLLAEICAKVQQKGVPITDVDFATRASGHEARLRADCHVLRGSRNEVLGTVMHLRDITERVLTQDRIKRMERFLGLGTLAAGLHHEVRNPLGALSLHVQLLDERLNGQADAEVKENLGVLKTEVARIAGVLESFRSYASADRINVEPSDMMPLLRQTAELMRPKADQQGVRIRLVEPEERLPKVQLDPVRFEQVLLNLVINALDELDHQGEIALSAAVEDDHLHIRIADNGPGIPRNIRCQIFDPYFTTKGGGSGMGLALCDKIVQQHDGTIDFESSARGTTFCIALPIDLTDE